MDPLSPTVDIMFDMLRERFVYSVQGIKHNNISQLAEAYL